MTGRRPLALPAFTEEGGSAVRTVLGGEGDLVDGRYRIVERVGNGGMGVVFRADDVFLDRRVALKLVPSDAGDAFVQEARALARVRHDNVVPIYAFGAHESSLYFAMEYVVGKDLATIVDEETAAGRTLPRDRALAIVRDVARGLDAVHAAGLVHRDVKPSNIVLEDGTGRPVLIDFGLVLRAGGSAVHGGTPSYMAPEQALDAAGDKCTPRSDLYALACTAYELLTGQVAFDGPDTGAILVKQLKEPPPRISRVDRSLAPLDAVFLRALAKEPSARQESCVVFAAELEAALRKVRACEARADAPRVRMLLLVTDDGVRRHVERIVDRALEAFRVDVEHVTSAGDLIEAYAREPAEIVLVDDESTSARSERLFEALRAAPGGEAIEALALVRNPTARSQRLAVLGVRELPKPIVMHALGVTVARMAASVLERRRVARAADTLPPPA